MEQEPDILTATDSVDQDQKIKNHMEFIQQTCQFLKDSEANFEDKIEFVIIERIARYFGIIFALGGLFLLLSDKRFRTHPGGLVALIFATQTSTMQTISQLEYVCNPIVYKTFAFSWTIPTHLKYSLGIYQNNDEKLALEEGIEEAQFKSFGYLIISQYGIYEVSQFAYLFLCICLPIDLYQTVQNPLYPAKKRMNLYILGTLVAIAILFTIEHKMIKGSIFRVLQDDQEDTFSDYYTVNENKWKILLCVPLITNLIIGFYAYCKAYQSFFVPGVGQEVRVQVTRRQMYFVLITLICNMPTVFIQAYIGVGKEIFGNNSQDWNEDDQLIKFDRHYLRTLQYSCSLWLLLLTISDPFTFTILKSKCVCSNHQRKCADAKKKRDKKIREAQIKSGSMQNYLQSSLSFEIIYTVLNAIVMQIKEKEKNLVVKKKKVQIRKLKTMVKDTKNKRRESSLGSLDYQGFDFYDEYIYKLDKNIIRNLDQLDDYAALKLGQRQKSEQVQTDFDDSIESSENTLRLKRKVIVKQYAPKTFQRIRQINHITDEQICESLNPAGNIKQIQNAGLGAGASGSFFFFSADRKFILKTVSQKEVNHLQRALPNYFEHLDQCKNTLLAKKFGLFSVRMDQFSQIHVLIMENSLPSIENTELHYIFDMKGSSINREVLKGISTDELIKMEPTGGETLKDLDYVRLNENKNFFNMRTLDTKTLLKHIQIDVNFLKRQRFMDYSLLFAVRRVTNQENALMKQKTASISQLIDSENSRALNSSMEQDVGMMSNNEREEDEFSAMQSQYSDSYNKQCTMHSKLNDSGVDQFACLHKAEPIYSKDGKWAYQIAIIDYLQTFDKGKSQEVLAKRIFKNADPAKLSAVPPDPYGDRFVKFMKNFVFQKSTFLIEKERAEDKEGILAAVMEQVKIDLQQSLKMRFLKKTNQVIIVNRLSVGPQKLPLISEEDPFGPKEGSDSEELDIESKEALKQ